MAHEVLLYGLVYPHEVRGMGFEDGLTDQELLQNLAEADGDEVVLRINSRGGSADAAFAMNTLLSQYAGKTTAKIDGLSASAGTIVMLGADHIEIAENAAIMVHKAHVGLFGEFDADDLQNVRTELGNYDKRIAALYSQRMGTAPEEWLQMLTGETYYTAEEAMEAGFVDEVTKNVSVRIDYSPVLQDKAPKWLKKRFGEFTQMKKPVDQDVVADDIKQMLASDAMANVIT